MDRLKILLLMLLTAAASGCVNNFDREEFSQMSDIGLYVKGQNVLIYDDFNFQIGFSRDRNEFWVTDDNMANYFILDCEYFPENGSTVKADLVYTTSNDIKTRKGLVFEVSGPDGTTGKISFWNQSGRIGIIARVLDI